MKDVDRPPSEIESLFAEGYRHAREGRLAAAETVFRTTLSETRGTGTALESRACGNLGSLFSMTGRHFEALGLYRRALAIDEALGAPRRVVRHLANIASTFGMLELWEAVGSTFEELDHHLEGAPDALRDEAFELTLWPRFYAAMRDGDAAAARELHDRIAEAYRDRAGTTMGVSREILCADLLCLEGKPEEALSLLEGVRPRGESEAEDSIQLATIRLGCLVLLERREEHAALAKQAAGEIEAWSRAAPVSDVSIDLACEIASHLAEYPEHAEAACHVYDLAATMVLRRIRQLAARWEELPELAETSARDLAYLRLLRNTYHGWQTRLMEAVVETIRRHRDSLGAELFTGAGATGDAIVRLCAWCGRLHTRSGHWLPVAHYVPGDDDLWVSHAICPDCVADQRSSV